MGMSYLVGCEWRRETRAHRGSLHGGRQWAAVRAAWLVEQPVVLLPESVFRWTIP